MDLEFKGRVAIVTGASGSIGSAIARRLAREGASVIIGYHTREDLATQVAGEIVRAGREAYPVQVDVRSSASVKNLFTSTVALAGTPDCLINVAGIAAFAPTASLPEAVWSNVISTNLTGSFLCCQAALPYMLKAGFGDIVNISSIAATIGAFEGVAYSASKAALDQFTKSLALEVGAANIRVNAVAPGRIDTPFRRQKAGEYFDFMIEQTPQRRLGTIDELANTVVFLASRACPFITGEVLTVSGGLSTVFLKHVAPEPDSKLNLELGLD